MSAEEDRSEREELEELMKALKAAIMELRSTIDELTNPIVPPPTPVKPSKPAKQAPQAREAGGGEKTAATQPAGPSRARPAEEAVVAQPPVQPAVTARPVQPAPQVAGGPAQAVLGGGGVEGVEVTLDRLARLIRLVYELQARVPPEYLSGLADILYGSGLIDEAQRDTLKRIVDLARLGFEHGLSVDESVAILAALAKELGLDVTAITEELVRAVLRRRGAERWESQQQ